LFSGALLILWGAGTLLGSFRRGLAPGVSTKLSIFVTKTLRIGSGSLFAPLLLGTSSAFLPCGWLYTYHETTHPAHSH
jgi:sulfite exporter TauE/SafE